jgi:hypothetical protein
MNLFGTCDLYNISFLIASCLALILQGHMPMLIILTALAPHHPS